MKKQIILGLVIMLSFYAKAQTTQETEKSRLALIISSKLGFAKLKQTDFATIHGNINTAEGLVSLKMGKKWELATGLNYSEFNGNVTISGNTASIKNSYLQIPLKALGDFSIFNKEGSDSRIFLTIGGGIYANTLLKSELETVSGDSKTKNLGWNFGLSTQIGAKFVLSDVMDLGIGLNSQSDFSKMKKDGIEQKMEQVNALYFNIAYKI